MALFTHAFFLREREEDEGRRLIVREAAGQWPLSAAAPAQSTINSTRTLWSGGHVPKLEYCDCCTNKLRYLYYMNQYKDRYIMYRLQSKTI